MRFFCDSTGKRVGFANGTMLFYYLYNVQGDVIAIVRAATGQVVAKYSYDAWASVPSPTPPATPWATKIPSATEGTITTPRRAFIISTAAIITRSSGGLLVQMALSTTAVPLRRICLHTATTIPLTTATQTDICPSGCPACWILPAVSRRFLREQQWPPQQLQRVWELRQVLPWH